MQNARVDQVIDRLVKAGVELGWHTRLVRELTYARGLEKKRFPLKSLLALQMLSFKSELSISEIATLLQLSTMRTRKALEPLIKQGIISQENEGSRVIYKIQPRARIVLDEMITQSAERYARLLHMLPALVDRVDELAGLAEFVEEVRDAFDRMIRAGILG